MKFAFLAALAVSSVMSGALLAQEGQTFVVTSHRNAVTQWTSTISRDLDRSLKRFLWTQPEAGIVSIRFNYSDDGKAENIVVTRGSGSPNLDRAATRAIAHIKSLYPLPGALASNQLVQANIFFALDEGQLKQQVAQLRREKAASRAASKSGDHLAALNLDVRVAG